MMEIEVRPFGTESIVLVGKIETFDTVNVQVPTCLFSLLCRLRLLQLQLHGGWTCPTGTSRP